MSDSSDDSDDTFAHNNPDKIETIEILDNIFDDFKTDETNFDDFQTIESKFDSLKKYDDNFEDFKAAENNFDDFHDVNETKFDDDHNENENVDIFATTQNDQKHTTADIKEDVDSLLKR